MILVKENFSFIQSAQIDPSWIGKTKYELLGRITSLGAALFLIAEAVVHTVMAAFAFLSHLLTCGYLESAREWSMKEFSGAKVSVSVSGACFLAVFSPKILQDQLLDSPLAPFVRENRIRFGRELIQRKLDKELRCAKNQMIGEQDGDFQYLEGNLGHTEAERVGKYNVGVCHFIGRRPDMEDEHLATQFDIRINGRTFPVRLFALFDGHGGDEASKFLKANLKEKLAQMLVEMNRNDLSDMGIWNALKMTFVRLNEEFNEDAGSTATVAMILDGKIWTANVGDARTILVNGDEVVQLTEDANPTDERYQKGILNRGGTVFWWHGMRVNGQIAVARAFGDHVLEGAMSARPKITAIPLEEIEPGSHLVLACDGIYDVASSRQVGGAVRDHADQPAVDLAKNIVFSAFQADSQDNLSAMVVKL